MPDVMNLAERESSLICISYTTTDGTIDKILPEQLCSFRTEHYGVYIRFVSSYGIETMLPWHRILEIVWRH